MRRNISKRWSQWQTPTHTHELQVKYYKSKKQIFLFLQYKMTIILCEFFSPEFPWSFISLLNKPSLSQLRGSLLYFLVYPNIFVSCNIYRQANQRWILIFCIFLGNDKRILNKEYAVVEALQAITKANKTGICSLMWIVNQCEHSAMIKYHSFHLQKSYPWFRDTKDLSLFWGIVDDRYIEIVSVCTWTEICYTFITTFNFNVKKNHKDRLEDASKHRILYPKRNKINERHCTVINWLVILMQH